MQTERRLYPRYNVDFLVTVKPITSNDTFSAQAVNLSMNGINVICSDSGANELMNGLSYSDQCELQFELDDDIGQCYATRLTVKRRLSQTAFSLGFQFVGLDNRLVTLLEDYLSLRRLMD